MAITGIPSYDGKPPTEYRVRCVCGQRYWVFTGAKDFGRAFERAMEKSENTGRIFIDALQTPFMNCECGQALDFSTGEACGMVM